MKTGKENENQKTEQKKKKIKAKLVAPVDLAHVPE